MKPEILYHKSRMVYGVLALGALSLFSSMSAYAASDIIVSRPHHNSMSSNTYLGVSLGNAKYDEFDDSSAALSLFGGFHINEVLAVDFGWANLGEASQETAKAEVSVLQVALLGKLPVSTDFSLFGKVGLARWEYDLNTTSLSGSDDDINVYFGIGADYHISGRSAVRFSADFYNMKPTISNTTLTKENISLFSIGYLFQM